MNKSTSWQAPKPPFRIYKKKVFENNIKVSDFIYHIGESPILRQKSKHVEVLAIHTKDFQQKIAYLKKCLLRYRKLTGMGRGIAAVQIGILERLAVIYMPETPQHLELIINPSVTKRSQKVLEYPEICMSANPLIARVVRPAWIEFEYYTQQGEKKVWKRKAGNTQEKMYNRVFQHEIDHMDGIINIDTVQSKDLIFETDPTFYGKATFKEI